MRGVTGWTLAARVSLALLASFTLMPIAGSQARAVREFNERLPGIATEAAGNGPRVNGHVVLTIPRDWVRHSSNARTEAHLSERLSARCTARIEISTEVGTLSREPALEIEAAMDFWFEIFAPVEPRPLPLVAQHVSSNRAWSARERAAERRNSRTRPPPRRRA